MLGRVAAFEFRFQLRQPLFWIVFAFFFLIAFAIAATDVVRIGGLANAHRNSPYLIAFDHLLLSIFFTFVTAAFVAGAVLRDDDTGFGPIIHTTRLTKFDYLYGRFAGAMSAAVLAFAAAPLAIVIGAAMPWVDAELKGPFLPGGYAFAFLVLGLPTILFTGALFFTLATITRSMAWTFVGVIGLIVAYIAGRAALGKLELETTAAALDPFAVQTYGLITKYWTANDRNTLTPALSGVLLWNRLGVLGISAALLAAVYPLFRIQMRPGGAPQAGGAGDEAAPVGPVPHAQRFGPGAKWAQLVARTRLDMGQVFKSPVFLILLGLGLANSGIGLWFSTSATGYGGALWPVTRGLIPVLEGAFVFFPQIIAVFYAGELVWRERDRRTHEIIDAAPVPDWAFVFPKTLAVSLVLLATLLISVVAAIAIQAAKGYFHFEIGKYLLWYVLPEAVDLTLVAAFGVFLQSISPNKFAGWGLMVIYIIAIIALPTQGFEHTLYLIDNVSSVPLSDMNGQGRFWIGAWWMRLYWSAFTLILLVLAYGLWRRGAETRFWPRLQRLPGKLKGPAGWTIAAALAVFAGAGAYIYVNTNVWNDYRTQKGDETWLADYEKTLLPFAKTPQPSIVSVKMTVDVSPHTPSVETRGVYMLENRTGAPLREVHVRFDRNVTVCALAVEDAWAKKTYERFNYRIFAFDNPMQPGERRTLSFTTELTQRGFRNTGGLTRVVDNGTFVDSSQIVPQIGMTTDELLSDRAKRRKQHLPAELPEARLGDVPSRAFSYVGHAGWVTADITVSTVADQTPLAPGYKVSDVTVGGRRTARFVSEAPILDFFSVQSARYQIKTETYKGVALSVYYDAQHPRNVARMLRALETSLDYYQANFSPYQFRQARVVEFPDYARFAQSFAGTFPWSEGLGFIADYRDPEKIDLVTYVAAHEFAHQWWAHQIVGADQEGATSLSETLAQYSALRVMRRMYGPDQIRKFLKYELDSYLRARGGEADEEKPLESVRRGQGYIHYRKGSLVMYRLADEIGEDKVNAALRSLLAQYAFKGAPYPTALDLVAALRAQAPADKQQLITDLFEKITLYDLKTTAAHAVRRADGRYDVTLTVSAEKMYADGKGKETPAPMAEPLWVGLFDVMPGKAGFGTKSVVALERRPIHSGTQTLSFISARKPAYAGVDPYNELIDRNGDDNVTALK